MYYYSEEGGGLSILVLQNARYLQNHNIEEGFTTSGVRS
jgi:hypothetical protein